MRKGFSFIEAKYGAGAGPDKTRRRGINRGTMTIKGQRGGLSISPNINKRGMTTHYGRTGQLGVTDYVHKKAFRERSDQGDVI